MRSIMLPFLFLVFPLFVFGEQAGYEPVKGWEIRMGLGYIHTGPEMDRIWTDGFAWEMLAIGYKPLKFLGFETGFIIGLSGMRKEVKKTVSVYYPYTGEYGTQESAGGGWGGIPFGGRVCFRLFRLPLMISLGAGGLYGFEEESGINAEGYTTRKTAGLGYYLLAGIHIIHPSPWNPSGFGIQIRYVGGLSDAADFSDSFGMIPQPEHYSLRENRLLITADMYVDFKSRK